MRSAFPVILSGLMVLFMACRQPGNGNSSAAQSSDWETASPSSGQMGTPASVAHFTDAEQKLAIGEYSFAAAQLHKAIIAYRIETGKMRGNDARQANKAIDALIVLRKSLREGRAVDEGDLHLAIQNALVVEGQTFPLPEEEDDNLAVPVGGN